MKVKIYTDGGCHNSGPYKGLGAWAYVIINEDGRVIREDAQKGEDHTTNNRMEYIAFIEAMKWCLAEGYFSHIEVYSDSDLLVKSFTEWIYAWVNKNTISDKANPDLLRELASLREALDMTLINFKMSWIKAHAGHKWNEYVDKECTKIILENVRAMKMEQAMSFVPPPEVYTEFEELFSKITEAMAYHKGLTPEQLSKAQTMLTLQKPILEKTFLTL